MVLVYLLLDSIKTDPIFSRHLLVEIFMNLKHKQLEQDHNLQEHILKITSISNYSNLDSNLVILMI